MSKICGIQPGSLLDELNYLKKLGFDKKKENEIWSKFCLDCETDEKGGSGGEALSKFSSHPKRLCSETDASMASSRRTSVSSRGSEPNVDIKHINYVFQENKMKIQKARKKLHENLTQTRRTDPYRLDATASCSSTPRHDELTGQITTYYDRNERFEDDDNERKGSSAVSGKRTAPSVRSSHRMVQKNPSSLNSQMTIVTDTIFQKKFKMFAEKSLNTISDIRSLLECGVNPPDGEEDESRRVVRVKEFSNRFSRNYLYPLARQLEKLTETEHQDSGTNRKLLSAYQVVLNGLQAYHNHFPTSTGACSSDRLRSLLEHLLQLCDAHVRAIQRHDESDDGDFVKMLKLSAELVLQKIEERFSATPNDVVQKASSSKVGLKCSDNSKSVGFKSRKGSLETRLSMYNVPAGNFRRDPRWKKMMELWTKKRVNVKSRYKTATYRHRPPVEKKSPEEASFASKCRLLPKKVAILKRTPLTTPVNEDNITTLIQIEDDKDKREVVGVQDGEGGKASEAAAEDHEGIVMRLLQLVLDNNRRTGGEEDEAAKAADIVECLKAGGDVEVLRKVLETLHMGKEKGEEEKEKKAREEEDQLKLQIVRNRSAAAEVGAKRRKEPIVTVTGEKNAKLICITDENSIIETEDDVKSKEKDGNTEKRAPAKVVSSTETQTTVTSNKKNKGTQKSRKANAFKMKRLPKSSKSLQKLPKDYALSIIQYKLDFHKHCKQNPMYKKSRNVQPWILMAKISNAILDGALLGVAREIELNNIVQQIYESEFQL